jgi:hypothetical protein
MALQDWAICTQIAAKGPCGEVELDASVLESEFLAR